MAIEYPKQIFCVWGNKVSLDAAFELQTVDEVSQKPPMEIHNRASRFALTLLDQTKGTTTPLTANLPAWDVAAVAEKTRVALIKKSEYKPTAENNLPPAYTLTFPFGPFQGNTPAGVLLSRSGDELLKVLDELQKTKELLEKNVKKYPARNKPLIEAIDNAFTLYDNGELKDITGSTQGFASSMLIYSREHKYKKPETADGCKTVYSIKILCDFTKDKYPWEVSFTNCFAPMLKKDNMLIPDLSKARDKKYSLVRLSDDDWLGCINRMTATINLFENKVFDEMYDLMLKYKDAWKEERKKGSA